MTLNGAIMELVVLHEHPMMPDFFKPGIQHVIETLSEVEESEWIPFRVRPLTEEEKEDYPEYGYILDCKLPDDGQPILVSINVRGHERVQYDEYYADDGCYLDSGYEIGTEATAWMPLPRPYKEEGDNE